MKIWVAGVAIATMLAACADQEAAAPDASDLLSVDLHTDYVQHYEFDRVVTELQIEDAGVAGPEEHTVRSGRYIDGVRIAELEVPAGEIDLVVTLIDDDDHVEVAERRLRLGQDRPRALTAVISRCSGDECHRLCAPERPVHCLGGCSQDSECVFSQACVDARCVRGRCLATPDDGRCEATSRCDPDEGCVPRPTCETMGTCSVPHARTECDGTEEIDCNILTCESGWDDCNRRSVDGCELSLSSPDACGACGVVCPESPGRERTCTVSAGVGTCGTMCATNYVDCNGDGTCETALYTLDNCMTCGDRCFAHPSMFVQCNPPSACQYTCYSGYANCNTTFEDGCETTRESCP